MSDAEKEEILIGKKVSLTKTANILMDDLTTFKITPMMPGTVVARQYDGLWVCEFIEGNYEHRMVCKSEDLKVYKYPH